jgi:hypothetical protein
MGNIYKGHILRGKKTNHQYSKPSFEVEIIEMYKNTIIGRSKGETLEKARIAARPMVDERIKQLEDE